EFGDEAFNGDRRWLAVEVQCTGDGGYTALDPRQELTPAPYALALPGLWTQPNVDSPNLIGGYWGNEVTAGVVGATIAGGGFVDHPNRVTADYATVGGGHNNEASGWDTTVGGGDSNAATIEGATVGGGYSNAASSYHATVGGGYSNDASGTYATVPGGRDNEANGDYSFAAGHRAKATHNGSFVLADSTAADFTSVRADALRVRFNGGATFLVNDDYWVCFYGNAGRLIDTSTGAHLTTGGVWTNDSDREAKENFAPVDGQDVLAQVTAMPIQTWNYKAEDPDVRRMSPTAQDFYAAFGLGEDERHISTIDADGVALAAIQGMYEQVQEQAARIQALEAENATMHQALEDLSARLAALEAAQTAGEAGP
ncbi:MAG: tail fiber domain-containing protein, partial [Anaerolineae bacterium]